jgi:hypothetical protein
MRPNQRIGRRCAARVNETLATMRQTGMLRFLGVSR